MSRADAPPLDEQGRDTLCRTLGDTPETVIAVHLLRRGQCSAYAVGGLARPDAVVIQPTHPSLAGEPTAFGPDPEAIWRLLRRLTGWTCVNVSNEVARRLGPIMESHLGRPVRYLGDVYHTLDRPAATFGHPAAKRLARQDLALLAAASPEIRDAALVFGSFEGLLDEGVAAGAVVDGNLVAIACTTAQAGRHADLGVVTGEPWRGRGLAAACASLTAAGVQQAGRVPVWSAGENNGASLRLARKLGFEEVGRRTYVVPIEEGNEPR